MSLRGCQSHVTNREVGAGTRRPYVPVLVLPGSWGLVDFRPRRKTRDHDSERETESVYIRNRYGRISDLCDLRRGSGGDLEGWRAAARSRTGQLPGGERGHADECRQG